jgi:NADH-quinone oxidoreductase subunit G
VPVAAAVAVERARALLATARHPVALISSWGSNEELAAFKASLGARVPAFVKRDRCAEPGEVSGGRFPHSRRQEPEHHRALALFPRADDPATALPAATDLLLVWGEGFDPARRPPGARLVMLDGWAKPEHALADVFIPLSIHTERSGTYTNFQGVASAFEACFAKPESAMDAASLFAALAARESVTA